MQSTAWQFEKYDIYTAIERLDALKVWRYNDVQSVKCTGKVMDDGDAILIQVIVTHVNGVIVHAWELLEEWG